MLRLLLREYGLKFFHNHHHVLGGECGTLSCYLDHVQLIYVIVYYHIVDEHSCTTSTLLKANLPHDILKQQLGKLRCIHLINHWYHVTFSTFLSCMPNDDDVPFLLDGMIWASLIHDIGERVFGDLFPSFPLEGNLIVATNQHVLYT